MQNHDQQRKQMHQVYLTDRNMQYDTASEYFLEALFWAQDHCVSFVDHDVQDVSDHTLYFDQVAIYNFNNAHDALMFTLKWKLD
jgi:hypothetical protein